MKSDVNKLHLECSWKDLTEGLQIYGEATSVDFNTGEWTESKASKYRMSYNYSGYGAYGNYNGYSGYYRSSGRYSGYKTYKSYKSNNQGDFK